MPVIVFILAGMAAWAHFEFIGPAIVSWHPIFRVWPAWYFAVLLAAIWSIRKRDYAVPVSAVLVASFMSAHLIANVVHKDLINVTQSFRMVAVAGALIILFLAFRRWQIAAAALAHAAIVAFGFAADYKLMFEAARAKTFIAWSFPDVSAGLQHAALLCLACPDIMDERATVADSVGSRSGGDNLAGASVAKVPKES